MTLKDAIDAMERWRMRLIESVARLIDDVKMGDKLAAETDKKEVIEYMKTMAALCAPQDAFKFHRLIMMVERAPPPMLVDLAPHVVSIIFHYDRFPFTVVDFELVLTN